MGRLARSWDLFKQSMGVVKQDPELMWMPILSFIATLVMLAGIFGIGWVGGLFPEIQDAQGNVKPAAIALSFVSYVGLAFVQVYFHAATVHAANERLGGGDPTVGSALRGANKHLFRLFLWSLVVATVNVILQALRQAARNSRLPFDDILVSLVGTAWNLATYFVVPILIFEDMGVGGSLKQSGRYFKKTWGESIVGEVGIGFVAGIVTIGIVLVGLLLLFLLGGLGTAAVVGVIALTVLAVIVASIVFTVAAAVYKTALFRYAREGSAGGPFSDQQLANAYHVK